MAIAYSNLNEAGRAAENARKAYELREKVSERERFAIEATYYMDATGELEKAAQAYELWQQTYPRDGAPYANLGHTFTVALETWKRHWSKTGRQCAWTRTVQANYAQPRRRLREPQPAG